MKMDLSIILKIFESTVLGGLLVLVAFGLWKALVWLGTDILKPMKERVVAHIDTLDLATERMERTVEKIQTSVAHQGEAIAQQTQWIQAAAKSHLEHAEQLNRIDRNVEEVRQKSSLFFGQQDREYSARHPNEKRE